MCIGLQFKARTMDFSQCIRMSSFGDYREISLGKSSVIRCNLPIRNTGAGHMTMTIIIVVKLSEVLEKMLACGLQGHQTM